VYSKNPNNKNSAEYLLELLNEPVHTGVRRLSGGTELGQVNGHLTDVIHRPDVVQHPVLYLRESQRHLLRELEHLLHLLEVLGEYHPLVRLSTE